MAFGWLLIGALIGILAAQKKGWNVAVAALAGAVLGPLSFLMFFVSSISGGQRKCPFCAEWVSTQALICKHCHKDLPPKMAASAK